MAVAGFGQVACGPPRTGPDRVEGSLTDTTDSCCLGVPFYTASLDQVQPELVHRLHQRSGAPVTVFFFYVLTYARELRKHLSTCLDRGCRVPSVGSPEGFGKGLEG